MNHTRTITRLLLTMTAAVGLSAAALAAALAVFAVGSIWWHAWTAAVLIAALAATMSLAPVVPGILAGGQWAVYGHLAGSVLRVLVASMACIAAVLAFRAPPVQTLVLTLPLYFVQLVIEAVVVGRAFRTGGQVG